MLNTIYFFIITTIILSLAVSIVHLSNSIWKKWERLMQRKPIVHYLVGAAGLLVVILNLFILINLN